MTVSGTIKNIGRLSVIFLIVLSPWRNGAFEPRVLRILLWLVVASGISALLSLWTTPLRERKVNSYGATILLSLPLFVGLLLGIFQATTLSPELLGQLSPSVFELKRLTTSPTFGITLDELLSGNRDSLPDEVRTKALERANFFLNSKRQVFPYEENVEVVARSLVLDGALEQKLLPESGRSQLREWGDTISVYPLATRQSLPAFWAAVVVFLASSILFNTVESRRVLLKAVVFTGLVMALFCVAMRANPSLVDLNKFNYWWLIDRTGSFGPYVNKNAAAGYLVLCFGACLYFISREFIISSLRLRKELKDRRQEERELRDEAAYSRAPERIWKVVLGDVFELFNRRLTFWLFVLGFLYAAILASLSRGATIAASSAFLLSVALMLSRPETRKFWYAPLTACLIALGALAAVSLYESVDDRLSTLVEEDELGDAVIVKDLRWDNWRAAINSSKDYPWFGSGLGTYRYANLANDQATKYGRLFFYAENTFVQTLLEMGRVGVAALLLEYVLLLILFGRFLTRRHGADTFSFAVAGTAIIVGQIISSSFDFGIYLPANMLLFALLCGAISGRQNKRLFERLNSELANRETSLQSIHETRRLKIREWTGMFFFSAATLFVLLGTKSALNENADHIQRRELVKSADIAEERLIHMSSTSVDSLIRKLREFISRRDDSYEARNALAELEIIRFRLQYKELLEQERPEASPEELWNETLPERLLTAFLDYQWRGLKIPVGMIRDNKLVAEGLTNVASDYLASRKICPLRSGVHAALMGLIPLCADLDLEDERNLADLYARRSAILAPYDSGNLLAVGYRLGCFKLWTLEKFFLRRVAENNKLYAPQILKVLEDSIPESDLAEAIDDALPDDVALLCQSISYFTSAKSSLLFHSLENKTKKCLSETPENKRDSEFYYWAGFFYNKIGDYETAQEQLAKSYELDDNNDDSFFLRMQILCEHSSTLLKDEECVRALTRYCENHKGNKLWQASELLEKAQKNRRRNVARVEARERVRREREQDNRIREEVKRQKAYSSDNHEGDPRVLSPGE